VDEANHWHRWLLRARHRWPRRRAAKCRDELAPLHSITSSARQGECWIGLNKDTIPLHVDDLFGLRDCEVDRIVLQRLVPFYLDTTY
jgi:hypothetical protein